jgi:hypothetical protein
MIVVDLLTRTAMPAGYPRTGQAWHTRCALQQDRRAQIVRVTMVHEAAAGSPHADALPTAAQLRQRFRLHAGTGIYDDSGTPSGRLAIYTLSDPRDIRNVRYVGQTSAPRRRLLQHLNHARLWLPEDLPWWVKQPRLRPLYAWVRELYREQYRLPVMVISAWAATAGEARASERARISACLASRLALLNVDIETLRGAGAGSAM